MSATRKGRDYAIQHISIYFNYIGRFENEVTQLAEPDRAGNPANAGRNRRSQKGKEPRLPPEVFKGVPGGETLKSSGEYERIKARGIPGKEKGADRRRTARTVKQNNRQPRGDFPATGSPSFVPGERSCLWQNRPPTVSSRRRRNGQTIVAELFFNHSSTGNIPRQAAQDDTCRQFVFICV